MTTTSRTLGIVVLSTVLVSCAVPEAAAPGAGPGAGLAGDGDVGEAQFDLTSAHGAGAIGDGTYNTAFGPVKVTLQ